MKSQAFIVVLALTILSNVLAVAGEAQCTTKPCELESASTDVSRKIELRKEEPEANPVQKVREGLGGLLSGVGGWISGTATPDSKPEKVEADHPAVRTVTCERLAMQMNTAPGECKVIGKRLHGVAFQSVVLFVADK